MSQARGVRKVGLWACATLVVANMVGTGVFTSLGFQVSSLPSPFVILCLWAVGGVVAFCGALSYAELAAAMPRSGGEYNFLTAIYHPGLGFAAGFVSVVVGFAAPIALAAMAVGEYLADAIPGLPVRTISFSAVLGIAAAHAVTLRISGVVQVVVTVLKVSLILGFLVVGFLMGNLSGANFAPAPGDGELFLKPSFAVALMFVLYSYTGWNAAAYIIGEVREPQRTVPAALLLATLFVTFLYVALNALFLRSAPMEEFAGSIQVGRMAATALFGDFGGRAMAVLIGGGLLASISAMTWAGPRVAQAVGTDFSALSVFRVTSVHGIPRRALLLQTGLVIVYLLTGTFETVLVYAQFALVLCSFLTVLGVFVLRFRKPLLARPFRCWGYPVTPAVFLGFCLFALAYTAVENPAEALAGASTLGLGWGLYAVVRDRKSPTSSPQHSSD